MSTKHTARNVLTVLALVAALAACGNAEADQQPRQQHAPSSYHQQQGHGSDKADGKKKNENERARDYSENHQKTHHQAHQQADQKTRSHGRHIGENEPDENDNEADENEPDENEGGGGEA